MKDRVIAFVHAKGTSERVPSKNLRVLGDRPLFCHAIDAALRAQKVDRVVIDSDSDEILQIGQAAGATPIRRPPALATNRTSGDELAYWQASWFPESLIVMQVIPTAPFLRPESIDAAVTRLERGGIDSVVGVFEDVFYKWENGRPAYYTPDGRLPNSTELGATVFETTGLYANLTAAVLRLRRRMNPERAEALPLSRVEAVDINTPEDFAFAEIVWRGLRAA